MNDTTNDAGAFPFGGLAVDAASAVARINELEALVQSMQVKLDAFTNMAAHAMTYLMSDSRIQQAIVDAITCNSPIGQMLNRQIEGAIGDHQHSADEIDDLDNTITTAIEAALENHEIEADNVEGLATAVEGIVTEALGELYIARR